MSRPKPTVAALAVVAALGAGGVAGCTSSGPDGTSSAPSSTAASSSQRIVAPSIAPTRAQRSIPADSQIVETPALRKTISLTSCAAASGGWAGSGTAKNPTSKAQTYRLLVFFTDKYSRTINYARTDVSVAAGKTATWRAATTFDAPSGTKCVLRGLYAVEQGSKS